MIESEDQARAYAHTCCQTEVLDRLDEFSDLLRAENARQNLIANASLDAIWQRHIVDSLQLLAFVPRETSLPIIDLGSGAGFPGLVLALARPDLPIRLIESRKKRVEWLDRVVNHFRLEQCRVIGSRLETVETFQASAITARAFAPLLKLLALSARFSTPDTVWLLPKGRSAAQELENQPPIVQNMFHVEQSITDIEAKILVGRGIPPA